MSITSISKIVKTVINNITSISLNSGWTTMWYEVNAGFKVSVD